MKTLIATVLLASGLAGLISTSAQAQEDSTRRSKRNIRFGVDVTAGKRDSTGKIDQSKGYFVGGITFTRLDIGFSRLIDNGSFSLSPKNDFLEYKGGKTSTVSFDVLQLGYRFSPNFKIYVAGGFDWTMIRLKNNYTILGAPDLSAVLMPAGGPVYPTSLSYKAETVNFSKNRFSSSYIHIPLNFEFRTNENDNGKRFYFVVGPEVGFLLGGKVKQVSDERGKQKFKDDYNFQPFRYGGTFRMGYGSLGVFAKYYANDMFDTEVQKGLKNMSFGITFGLN